MRSEIDNATTARQGRIVEPGLVWSVRIVEHEVSGVNGPELATTHDITHLADATHESVGEVDTQQLVRSPCSCDYPPGLMLCSTERFLAEDCDAPFEGRNGLFGVKSARCCDHNPIEIGFEKLLER